MMNLVISVTSLTFNPTTEILTVASEKMKEAVRLVHHPSCTVFSNFPVVKKKHISLHTMDFFLLEVDILPWGMKRARLEVQVVPLLRLLERVFEIQLTHKRSLS